MNATSNNGTATEAKVDEVMNSALKYGKSSIIALAGVPGTGKSFVARIAAQRLATTPEHVLEIQFHPSSSYEEFIEGLRVADDGSVGPENGAFLAWNEIALANPDEVFVVLIDEFSRANLPAVLGEAMTFVEDRARSFTPTYSRNPIRIARNLILLVTFNPTDRSALEIDNALLRRLRIIDFPPDPDQLADMLRKRLSPEAIEQLGSLFVTVRIKHPDIYEHQMPFGHGVFAEVRAERPDLYELWQSRLRHMLRRPLLAPNPLTSAIEDAYPWTDPAFEAAPIPAAQADDPPHPVNADSTRVGNASHPSIS